MFSSPDNVPAHLYQTEGSGKSPAREAVPGWLGSLVVHLLFLMLVFMLMRTTPRTSQSFARLVPVNVVQLGENTVSPPQQRTAAVPQQRAPALKSFHRNQATVAVPTKTRTAPDTLEAQLRALSTQRESDANLPALDNGASNVDATSTDAASGSNASYSVRDYIRNQAERRWSLNLHRLGTRNYVVQIHIELRRNGIIDKAEIVDKARFAADAAYRDVALSARNAVLLSSPIALPAGQLEMPMNFTLRLNSKDMFR